MRPIRACGIGRMADNDKALLVYFDRRPTDDEMRDIHDRLSVAWQCGALKQGTAGGNYPADCGWPECGCDPAANKVMEAMEEAGYRPPSH